MSGENSKLATFDGEREHWQSWKNKRDGWKVINKRNFKGYFGVTQPSKRDRVTTAYTVDDDQEDYDPTGAAPGTRVNAESVSVYKRKDREWIENDVLWFYLQSDVFGGKAEELADEMTEKSGVLLETKLAAHYEQTTNSHAAHTLTALVTMKKALGESVEKHSAAWTKSIKRVEANMDWPQIKCCLFLASLGEAYQGFFDIATTTTDKMDLQDLMKRAADYRRGTDNDESDTSAIAMTAQFNKNCTGTKPTTNLRNEGQLRKK